MWELERHDWVHLRASGSAHNVPVAIMALLNANNETDADKAYWRIDNTVVVQGALFEAAVATAQCLVVGLAECTLAARPRVLELLLQLSSGEDAPEETELGTSDLAGQCIAQVCLAVSILLKVLESGTLDEQSSCVDLLGLCARRNPALRPRVRWYFERYQRGNLSPSMQQLVSSWIGEF